MKIVKVVFLSSKDELPKIYRSYNYLMDNSLVTSIDIGVRDNDKWTKYEITNSDGFSYRGSKVIFIAYRDIDKDKETVGYKKIIKAHAIGSTSFGDTVLKDLTPEQFNLAVEGWKLTNQTINNIMGSYNAASNTNCCTASSSTVVSTGTTAGDTLRYNGDNWFTTTPYTTTNWTYVSNIDYGPTIAEIQKRLDKIENKDKKESKKMFESLTKGLKCGRAQDVRMSIYGPAFKSEDGNWYVINEEDELLDVSDLLLDMDSYCYMIPVAKNQIKEGDFILHAGRWVKIVQIEDNKVVGALDFFKKEFIVPMVTKSPFGFEFYTKLIPLLDFTKMQASTDTPFGALPMILMMNNKNDKDMLPMLMMMGTQGGFNFDMSNPMMMYFLMKDGGNDNLLPFLMMNQMNKATD